MIVRLANAPDAPEVRPQPQRSEKEDRPRREAKPVDVKSAGSVKKSTSGFKPKLNEKKKVKKSERDGGQKPPKRSK